MANKVALQPAYLLHRRPYRETSLLLEAFTAEHGRIGLVARGVRRGRGRLQGVLQPFQPLLLSWSGRGELLTLTDAEADGAAVLLRGRAVISGFYLNELLLRLLARHDPHPELFRRYSETLPRLPAGEEWTLRRFECALLDAIGYGLGLETDLTGEPIEPERRYRYRLEIGPEPESAGTGGLAVQGATLLALAGRVPPPPESLGECKRLLRAALALYLGDKPLASRALYRQALKN